MAGGRPGRCWRATTFTLVCQVNGKVRDRVQATPAPRPRSSRPCAARPRRVAAQIDGREVVKEIVVPGKLVNVVVR